MDLNKLGSQNADTVKNYVQGKFKSFKGMFVPKKTARQKCIRYYLAAEKFDEEGTFSSLNRKEIVKNAYFLYFKRTFPVNEAEQEKEKRNLKLTGPSGKMEASEWAENKEDELAEARRVLTQLGIWRDEGEYQGGPDFFLQLQQAVAFLDESLLNEVSFVTEYEANCLARLTKSFDVTDNSIKAEFDAMIGIKQTATATFEAYHPKWGEVNAKLEESFKAGAWASGKAVAEMTKLGFSAELQGAIAIGAEFEVKGECSWKKGDVGLTLNGNGKCFAGARASGHAKLSVSALTGIKASLKLDAFAGFEAKATGKIALVYDDKVLISEEATVGIQFGVGAKLSASIQSSIFGPTSISFETSVALGIGASVGTKTVVDFNGIYLAGRTEFRKVVYLPTLAKGWKMDLMTQDSKNLFYLNKCIVRLGLHIVELEEGLDSVDITSSGQSLLM